MNTRPHECCEWENEDGVHGIPCTVVLLGIPFSGSETTNQAFSKRGLKRGTYSTIGLNSCRRVDHDCGGSRGISYWVDGVDELRILLGCTADVRESVWGCINKGK